MVKPLRDDIRDIALETMKKVDGVKGVLRLSDLLKMQDALKAGRQLDPEKSINVLKLVMEALSAAMSTIEMLRTVDIVQQRLLMDLGFHMPSRLVESDPAEDPIGHQFGVVH